MKFAAATTCAAVAVAMTGLIAPAHAEGLGAELNYGRADGHWGAEIGAGYALGIGPFSLTPGAGAYIRDGGTRLYGRVEASYSIPASATIGMGLRVSEARTSPYATVSFPLLPKVALKGNVWTKYYTVGLTLGY